MFEDVDTKRFRGQMVGVATGGTSLEREISLQTGRAFEEALVERGYDVEVYDIEVDLETIADDRPAAMLLGIHGGRGESGALQGFLESLEIPYTGSGVLASALAMDKQRTRRVCKQAGVSVADGCFLAAEELARPDECVGRVEAVLDYPVVAKLNDGGSSVGVYICDDNASLIEALESLDELVTTAPSSGVLVEACIEGPEYTVGFFDDRPLGAIEVQPAETFYDYEAKYEREDTQYDVIDEPSLGAMLVERAKRALEAVGCRGVARVDFKGAIEQAVMLEINTIPGMTETSLVPKLAADRGVPFSDFVEAMLATARLDEEVTQT